MGYRKNSRNLDYENSNNLSPTPPQSTGEWPPPYTTPFPIKITFKVHLHGVAMGNFVSLFPMVTILWPIIWCTLPAACNNNQSRKSKPCHQTFIASYLNVMLYESYMQSNLVIFSLQTDSVRPWPWMESVRRKREAFTFHRIRWMCHSIEIQANQWTQIKLFATFLMLRVWLHQWCIQKLWIHTLWKSNDRTLALCLQIHAIYLKETVFIIVHEIYHAWCYLTDRVVIETQQY